MKQVDKHNRLWFETAEGETRIGFTEEFIQQMQDCFHIIPGKRRTAVRQDGPLMAVETNECLFSVRSPVGGVITFFNTKAQDFPEKLTVDEVVCIVADKKPEEKKEKKERSWEVNVFAAPLQAPAAPARFIRNPEDAEARAAAWRLVDQGVFTAEQARAWGPRPENV